MSASRERWRRRALLLSRETRSAPGRGASCPSEALCVVNDLGPEVFSSTDPTGGANAWTIARVGGYNQQWIDVSCPSTSLCVLVGQYRDEYANYYGTVATTTDPSGGAGAWTAVDLDPQIPPRNGWTVHRRGAASPLRASTSSHRTVPPADAPRGRPPRWTRPSFQTSLAPRLRSAWPSTRRGGPSSGHPGEPSIRRRG
jgi:hypothetical protein